ncbi:MAG TPA: winged helix-turn-helix domain-containing protein [Nitrososphaeraceae archaeon]|nr:winged helix-turn-helix domain-containing protein [Nitrososphaeraceae archaeon]
MIIKGQKLKQAILAALADEEIIKILDSAMYHSKSVNDVIKECDIPHTTAYRKIKWLLDEGLIVIDKVQITPDGKKLSLFRSVLKALNIKYEYNSVIIEADQNLSIVEKITERFFSLD